MRSRLVDGMAVVVAGRMRFLLLPIGVILFWIVPQFTVDSWIPKDSSAFLRKHQPQQQQYQQHGVSVASTTTPTRSSTPLFLTQGVVGGRTRTRTSTSSRIDTALWDGSGRREFLEQLATSTAAAATSTATSSSTTKRVAGVNQQNLPNSNRTRTTGTSEKRWRTKSSSTKIRSSSGSSSTTEGRSPKGSLGGKGVGGGGFRAVGKSGAGRGGGGSSGSNCFPADAWVEVYKNDLLGDDDDDDDSSKNHRWRRTAMKDLVLGDRVRTGLRDTDISTVYAFGMRDPETTVVFDQLVTESGHLLELTENHIVFSVEATTATATATTTATATATTRSTTDDSEVAWDIELGDSLPLLLQRQNGLNATRVVRRELIEKQGAFHPYTLDGKLMVNGFQVSVHSIDSRMPYLSVGGCLLYDLHGFQQLLFAPLRLLYRLSPKTYSTSLNHDPTDGSHHYVDLVESLQLFLLPFANEEEAVNFGSWSPLIELRIPVLLFLIGCDFLERQLVVALSKRGQWLLVAFCLGMTVLFAIVPPKKKKNLTPTRQRKPTAVIFLEESKSKQY